MNLHKYLYYHLLLPFVSSISLLFAESFLQVFNANLLVVWYLSGRHPRYRRFAKGKTLSATLHSGAYLELRATCYCQTLETAGEILEYATGSTKCEYRKLIHAELEHRLSLCLSASLSFPLAFMITVIRSWDFRRRLLIRFQITQTVTHVLAPLDEQIRFQK